MATVNVNGFRWTWRCAKYVGDLKSKCGEFFLFSTDQPEEYCKLHMRSHVLQHLKCDCKEVVFFKKEPFQIPVERD